MKRPLLAIAACLVLLRCSTSSSPPVFPSDAATSTEDASSAIDAAPRSDACPVTKTPSGTGDPCASFGEDPTTCDPSCGIPKYGYICSDGPPPGVGGCVTVRESALGNAYCCAELKCTPLPSQNKYCTSPGKLYSCPRNPADGGTLASPAAGCVKVAGPEPSFPYFCCP